MNASYCKYIHSRIGMQYMNKHDFLRKSSFFFAMDQKYGWLIGNLKWIVFYFEIELKIVEREFYMKQFIITIAQSMEQGNEKLSFIPRVRASIIRLVVAFSVLLCCPRAHEKVFRNRITTRHSCTMVYLDRWDVEFIHNQFYFEACIQLPSMNSVQLINPITGFASIDIKSYWPRLSAPDTSIDLDWNLFLI